MRHEFFIQIASILGWETSSASQHGLRLTHPALVEPLYCGIGKHWYTLSLQMREEALALQEEERLALYQYVLHLNDHMFMAKFSLDRHHNLLLGAEIPTSGLQEPLITSVLTMLQKYAQRYRSLLQHPDRLPPTKPVVSGQITSGQKPGITPDMMLLWLQSLNTDEWEFSARVREQTWMLYFKRRFYVYLTVTPFWTYFQISILKQVPSVLLHTTDASLQALFLKYVLRLNDSLYLAKFGLTNQKDLLLLLEMPTEALNFSLFQLAIRALVDCLENNVQEVQLMASLDSDQNLVEILNQRSYMHLL